jgi:hypothetical protein
MIWQVVDERFPMTFCYTGEGKMVERTACDCQENKDRYDRCNVKYASFPKITFSVFIMSLNTSALVHLGELAEPGGEEKKVDLELARHTIDTLAMLQEKTAGNLDQDEKVMLDNILCDLRMRYVRLAC